MSRMCTMGRQGVPSLFTYTRPVVYADATRSFKTISRRSRGDTPYAVAFRREVGLKCSSAIFARSRSTKTLDSPYGVTGLSDAVSSWKSSPAAPYVLHDEENTKRSTPPVLPNTASRTEAR